jgi:hypothetical protein
VPRRRRLPPREPPGPAQKQLLRGAARLLRVPPRARRGRRRRAPGSARLQALRRHARLLHDGQRARGRLPAWNSHLQPDFNVRRFRRERFCHRFVPKSAESTFDPQTGG